MNEPYIVTDEYQAYTEERDGLLFLHLTVTTWNKSVLEELRFMLRQALVEFEEWGYDVVFLTSESKKSVKMWNLVKPCFNVQHLKSGHKEGWLGSWVTGEDNGND